MIKFYNPFKKIKDLEKELRFERSKKLDPIEFIKNIMKDLEWFDYRKMDKQLWMNYFNEAKMIFESDVFNNELKHFKQEIVRDIAENSEDHDETMYKRTGLIFLESLKDRLGNIEDPRIAESKESIHDPI